MQFNVAALLQERTGAIREYDIDDDIVIDGEQQHLSGHIRLDRTPRGVLARARLHGVTEADCSRCLNPTTTPVEMLIEEEYIPLVDINGGGRVDPTETETENYRISERHILDLSEAVRQYWAIALPLAPLCREDCPGLCPHCGANLDETAHACAAGDLDSPWSKLRSLKLG